ncbi:MAG: methyltransferase domain-containing protein [Chloroflexi bacterium]|nr:methyltransferase domain-containing protein [Chloroflexota bacterium]
MQPSREWDHWDDPGVAEEIDRYWTADPSGYEVVYRSILAELVRTSLKSSLDRVLEVGCGSGLIYRVLVPELILNSNYVGVDTSIEMLRLARQHYTGGQFIRDDIYNLHLPPQSFDLVLCFEVLSHLPDIQKPISEMLRVTARTLIFTVWVSPDPVTHTRTEQWQASRFLHRQYAHDEIIAAIRAASTSAYRIEARPLSDVTWAYIVYKDQPAQSKESVVPFPGLTERMLRYHVEQRGRFETELVQARETLASREAELVQARATDAAQQTELELLHTKYQAQTGQLDLARGEIETQRRELDQARQHHIDLTQARATLESLQQNLAQARAELNARADELAQTSARLDSRESDLSHARSELRAREAERDHARDELRAREAEASQMRVILQTRESELNRARATMQTNDALLQIAQAQLARASAKGRVIALELDAFRQRRINRWLDRVSNRADAAPHLAPAFLQLKDDSYIFTRDLAGYRLQPSSDLRRVEFVYYPLDLDRANLRGVLLAPIFDFPPTQGALGIEIISPSNQIVAQVTRPANEINDAEPVRFDFAPIRDSNQ